MARFASPELVTRAPSSNSACDAGRGSSVLSKCDCNTLRIVAYRFLSVTVSFRSPRRALHPSHSCCGTCRKRQAPVTIQRRARTTLHGGSLRCVRQTADDRIQLSAYAHGRKTRAHITFKCPQNKRWLPIALRSETPVARTSPSTRVLSG